METWNQLSDDEIKMGFIASCIESAAERVGCRYEEMLDRMEAVRLIDNYLYPHYEALHTEDRNNLTENIIETLLRWEANAKNHAKLICVLNQEMLDRHIVFNEAIKLSE